MPAAHLHQLFSAAYDNALSEQQAAQFEEHLRTCAECTSAYEAFRISIDAVRALPPARMPHPVHLPSASPVAELPSFATRMRRISRLRLFPGVATGLAAAAAAVIVVIAVSRGNGSSTSIGTSTANLRNPSGTTASCVMPLAAPAAAPPAQYQHQVSAADPGRPGQQLVVATSTGAATAGSRLLVYAQLAFPLPVAGPANSAITPVAKTGAVPCLSLTGSNGTSLSPEPLSAPSVVSGPAGADALVPVRPNAGSAPTPVLSSDGQVLSFTIPPGTPRGTVLHVVASVPANYPLPGDPPLMVDLVITVQ
jgi:anti-sigma factor RsiW